MKSIKIECIKNKIIIWSIAICIIIAIILSRLIVALDSIDVETYEQMVSTCQLNVQFVIPMIMIVAITSFVKNESSENGWQLTISNRGSIKGCIYGKMVMLGIMIFLAYITQSVIIYSKFKDLYKEDIIKTFIIPTVLSVLTMMFNIIIFVFVAILIEKTAIKMVIMFMIIFISAVASLDEFASKLCLTCYPGLCLNMLSLDNIIDNGYWIGLVAQVIIALVICTIGVTFLDKKYKSVY